MAHACNASTGKAEATRPMEFTCQPAGQPAYQILKFQKKISKQKVGNTWGKTSKIASDYTHNLQSKAKSLPKGLEPDITPEDTW